MKRTLRMLVLVLVALAVLVAGVGCKKTNPEDALTQQIALDFAKSYLVERDSEKAMTFVVPITDFGYVTKEAVDSSILGDRQKQCTVREDSITVGPPAANITVPEVTDADRAKGISDRKLWIVAYAMKCGTSTREATRGVRVYLEKVNDKWGVSRCNFY